MKTILLIIAVSYASMLISEAAPAAANTVMQVTAYAQGGANNK